MTFVKYSKDAPFSAIRPDHANVALEFSPNFDPNKPAVMVMYMHGHGFALERDLAGRQNVIDQFRNSGVNGVLVAPQLMYDSKGDGPKNSNFRGYAASYAGSLQEKDGPQRFFDQTTVELSKLSGLPAEKFKNMPIVLNAYSGGGIAAGHVLEKALADKDRTLLNRIKGVNLMDGLFGSVTPFAQYLNQTKGFLNNNYIATAYDKGGNPHATQTARNTEELKKQVSPAAVSRMNNSKIAGVAHTPLVEGNANVKGAFSVAMTVAELQNYKEMPNGPAVAQNTAQADLPAPQGNEKSGKSVSSWLYEKLVPSSVKNYFYPTEKKPEAQLAKAPEPAAKASIAAATPQAHPAAEGRKPAPPPKPYFANR